MHIWKWLLMLTEMLLCFLLRITEDVEEMALIVEEAEISTTQADVATIILAVDTIIVVEIQEAIPTILVVLTPLTRGHLVKFVVKLDTLH
jgi:hypothetical protein